MCGQEPGQTAVVQAVLGCCLLIKGPCVAYINSKVPAQIDCVHSLIRTFATALDSRIHADFICQ